MANDNVKEIRNEKGQLFCKFKKEERDIILQSKTASIPLQELLSQAYNSELNEKRRGKKK